MPISIAIVMNVGLVILEFADSHGTDRIIVLLLPELFIPLRRSPPRGSN